MPSFFEGLKRLVQGKPVFNATDQPIGEEAHQAPPTPVYTDDKQQTGPKQMPQVTVVRCVCREEGAGLSCELVIHNGSQQQIKLTRVELLGAVDQLGSFLAPGAEREEMVHLAQRPQNASLNQCKLFYEAEDGDYFSTVHIAQFTQLPDRTFTIRSLNFQPPVRDV